MTTELGKLLLKISGLKTRLSQLQNDLLDLVEGNQAQMRRARELDRTMHQLREEEKCVDYLLRELPARAEEERKREELYARFTDEQLRTERLEVIWEIARLKELKLQVKKELQVLVRSMST